MSNLAQRMDVPGVYFLKMRYKFRKAKKQGMQGILKKDIFQECHSERSEESLLWMRKRDASLSLSMTVLRLFQ